jgi:hypothetical protein
MHPSIRDVFQLCDAAEQLVPGSALAARVRTLRGRLHEPPRVAVSGPVGAGSSTLVNALVGDRVSASGPGGATVVTTWFRGGAIHAASVVFHDRSTRPVALDRSDGLQIDLTGVDPATVLRIEVQWPADLLHRVTLIDLEPGTTVDADAHLTVQPDPDSSAPSGGGIAPSPVNTIAVATRADELDDTSTLPEPGREIDVSGLLAQAAYSLTPAQIDSLRALAAEPTSDTQALLRTADRFATTDRSSVPAIERAALLTTLGLRGVRHAIDLLRADPACTAATLRSALRDLSGITHLQAAIEARIVARAVALRCASVVNGLRSVAADLSAVDDERANQLVRAIERTSASLPEFDELRVLHLAMTGQLPISAGDADDLQRLWTDAPITTRLGLPSTASADTVRAVVLAGIGQWRERGDDMFAGPDLRDACGIVVRTYESIFLRLDQM